MTTDRNFEDNEKTTYDTNVGKKESVTPPTPKKVETTEEEEENDKSYNRGTAMKFAASAGLGVLLGSVTSFVAQGAIKGEESEENNADVDLAAEPTTEWADATIPIATSVNDDMTFSQAFSAARNEVGPGGAFEWEGNVYGTYTAEEWNKMTPEEKEEYNSHFIWSNYHSDKDDNSQSNSNSDDNLAEAAHQNNDDEHFELNEDAEVVDVAYNPEVEVEVIETTPEVEILGVVHDAETGANYGEVTIDGQEVYLIDIDGMDDNFDILVSDINGDGEITEDEIADISDEDISVSAFESNSFGDSSLYASNDGMADYINDATMDDYDLA